MPYYISDIPIDRYTDTYRFDSHGSVTDGCDITENILVIGKNITKIMIYSMGNMIFKQYFVKHTNYVNITPFEYGILNCSAIYSPMGIKIIADKVEKVYTKCII